MPNELNTDGYKLGFRKMIMYPDLSITGRLYGGMLLSWIDEAMAMLAMDTMHTQRIVTKKISEVNFKSPALLGDLLEIWGKETSRGRTSLTMEGKVLVKRDLDEGSKFADICEFSVVFVALDELGKPVAWELK